MGYEESDYRAERAGVTEVLRSLVDSPSDLNSTLQVILRNAVGLAHTDRGFIYLRDGDVYRHVSDVGASAEVVEFNKANPIRPGRGTSTGRAVMERRPVHIPDVELDDEYEHREAQRLGGFRTLLSVPMFLRDDVIGVVSVFRTELHPFTEREIDLLSMFAEQAALATVTSQLAASVESQRVELARFLPQQVADLISSPDGQKLLEGHRSELTVVFADIRGFTEFAATAEPEEVISVLGEYHREMGRHVTEFEGTLGGFQGDGLMIYFNDPYPVPDHAARAVAMAQGMQVGFTPLAIGWRKRGFQLGLGIGIATGYATLGRIGYEGRYDYTPIGTTVNLASRLCDRATPGTILASQRTIAAADIEATLLAEPLELKGIPQPVSVYTVQPGTRR
ncbi:MAG: adenylate/guanylate cyclase domain-containing protein [Ilumatobacteraceae bacterium]